MAEPRKRAPRKAAKPRTGGRSGQPNGKTPGVPIGLLVEVTVDGKTRTRHEILCGYLRLGSDVAVAAAKAKIGRATVHEWLTAGGRLAAQVEAGIVDPSALSPKDAALLAFGWEAVEAVADAEAAAHGNVVRLGQGITRRRVTTRKVGDVEEVTTVVIEDGPSLAANVFVLERRFAERWTRRQQIEITAADGADEAPPSPLPTLLADLAAIEARRREALAELDVVEVTAADG